MLPNSHATVLTLHCFTFQLAAAGKKEGKTIDTMVAAVCLVAAVLRLAVDGRTVATRKNAAIVQALSIGIGAGQARQSLDSFLRGKLLRPAGKIRATHTALNTLRVIKASVLGIGTGHRPSPSYCSC